MTKAKAKYVQKCPRECSLHPDKMEPGQAELLLMLRDGGAGVSIWGRKASEILGRELVRATVIRHLRHYKEVDETPVERNTGPRPSDVEILDELIVAGWRNSRNWKPSIRDTLEAMKLKASMTGNSAFQNMLDAMESGMRMAEGSEEDGPMPENPEALAAEDEREPEEEES